MTCVYTTDAPAALVLVPTEVTSWGAVVTFCPSAFVSVTDIGVEKVEKGWSVMVLVEMGTVFPSETFEACLGGAAFLPLEAAGDPF